MKVKHLKETKTLSDFIESNQSQEEYINEKNFFKRVAKRAKSFFKDKVKAIKKNAKKIIKDIKASYTQAKSPQKFKPGSLVAFTYDAKFKDGTKWDKKPLIISLGWSKNKKLSKSHFLGLNMHHLPIKDRVTVATFFVELLDKRKGQLSYEDVKPFMNKFKNSPVLRMYIFSRVSGKVIVMPDDVYLTACAVPSEIMVGA